MKVQHEWIRLGQKTSHDLNRFRLGNVGQRGSKKRLHAIHFSVIVIDRKSSHYAHCCSLDLSLSLKRPCSSNVSIRGRRGSMSRRSSRSKAYMCKSQFNLGLFGGSTYPCEMNEVSEKTVEMGLQTHMYYFGKMCMVDMCEYSEHLLVDRLTSGVKIWREPAFLANPRLPAGAWSTSRRVSRRAPRKDSGWGVDCGSSSRVGFRRKYSLVVDAV